jgi:hypothetical protein
MNTNQIKADVLGESWGAANSKLRKSILFHLAGLLDFLECYRCGHLIEHINDFSIEHKKSWMSSSTPIEDFYDIDNISFSHIRCNVGAANSSRKKYESETIKRKAFRERRKESDRYSKFLEYNSNWYARNKERVSQQVEETVSKTVQ